jgi:putative ABC transport system permease protein
MELVIASCEQGLIFLPLALGIHLSFRILNVTDLTVEGSFVLAAGMYARLILAGIAPEFAFLAALLSAAVCGMCVGLIAQLAELPPLIAGILMLFMLYSINFQIFGLPNINLLTQHTLLSDGSGQVLWGSVAAIALGVVAVLAWCLSRRIGLLCRAYGSNPKLLGRLGYYPKHIHVGGLAMSNMLAGLSGILAAEVNRYADLNMGIGMALTGIGTGIMGSYLLQRLAPRQYVVSTTLPLMGVGMGVLIYFLCLNGCLAMGINPVHLKLVLGLMLIVCLKTVSFQRGHS